MSTRWCLNCGSEYIATVAMCPDCDVALVDERPSTHLDGEGADRSGQLSYQLDEWAIESRVLLEQLLEGSAVPHAWEATTLVVPAALEGRVDDLIEQVEVTTLPTLDPEAEKVVYDVSDWDHTMMERLVEALDSVGLRHEFDVDGDLVVLAEDEERVEEVLDGIEFPDALRPDMIAEVDGDQPDAQDVLSELFVGADRLRRHARDHEGVLGLVAAASTAAAMELPFGFTPTVWHDIVGQATRLRDELEGDEVGDEEIEAHAGELRDLLRNFV